MKYKFVAYIETKKYDIGLLSKNVIVFDKNGVEITRFKDLSYGYLGVVSPDEKLLVVKSAEGRMAIYDLDKLTLIKKFRFSKIDYSQDDNFTFSPDGKYLYNIERQGSSLNSALSIYDTTDFQLQKRLFEEDKTTQIQIIEYDQATETFYVLGFIRNKDDGVGEKFFVAKLINGELQDMRYVNGDAFFPLTFTFYKILEKCGFTEESYKWLVIDKRVTLDQIKNMDLSLSSLWSKQKLE